MAEYVLLQKGRGTLRFCDGQHYAIIAHEGYAPFLAWVDPAVAHADRISRTARKRAKPSNILA